MSMGNNHFTPFTVSVSNTQDLKQLVKPQLHTLAHSRVRGAVVPVLAQCVPKRVPTSRLTGLLVSSDFLSQRGSPPTCVPSSIPQY